MLTFQGTYTQNKGDAPAAGTVTVTHVGGATDTATLDADGAYTIELDARGGTVTIVETFTGVPVKQFTTGVAAGATIDTGRDIGRVGFSGQGAATTVTANRQTASYTLVLTDADKVVEMNVATANDATLPPDTYDVNDCGEIVQWGAGQTTVVEGAGVTIRSPGGKKKIGAQYGACSWRLVASNEYHLEGNLAT